MAKILLIDDSSTVRAQLRGALEEHGFDIVEAENGAVGVQMAEAHEIDLMVVDVNMPVLNGIGAVRRIRAMPQYKRTPIFMLTTETSPAVAAEAKTVGATAWMVKPCRIEVLLRGVQSMLKCA